MTGQANTTRSSTVPGTTSATASGITSGTIEGAGPEPTAENHLKITGVHRSFNGVEVLKGLTLAVRRGTTTAIVGPSGSGKTTLLRLIAGFDEPDRGSLSLDGQSVAGPGVFVPAHKRSIGYVAQDGALFPHLTVGGNIAFGLERRSQSRQALRARVQQLLKMVSLESSYAERRPHELSGGQQQRVALARALARKPSLMLLDEPFSALDAGLRTATRKAVAVTLATTGVTTVLVTHDQPEALSFSDQVAVIRGGTLAQIGAPTVVYSQPKDQQTAEFLGETVILEATVRGESALCALGAIPVLGSPRHGPVKLMLRPEQIRITDNGPISGTVIDADFFGPDTSITVQLDPTPEDPAGTIVTIRHWHAGTTQIGTRLHLEVEGPGITFPQ